MYGNHFGRLARAAYQKGTTLIVALILILLATLLALFAMNVGIYGQRTSANDLRARLVQQTAEAGLGQAIEYFKLNFTTAMDPSNTALWKQCSATDTSFPCGTVEQFDASGALPRRSNMFYYIGGAGYDVNGNASTTDTLDKRSVPITPLTSVGNGFGVNYGVGALLCMVKTPTTATDPTTCTTDASLASRTKILTLTAVGNISGENAGTTLTTMVGSQSSVSIPANAPPVVASGTVTATGTLQIVTNPNSGGPGVPVSIWTRLSAAKTGTPNTCYMDGFIRDQKGSVAPEYEGVNTKIITCDDCLCTSSLSYTDSGNKQQEGIDILDVDTIPQCTDTVTTSCKPNLNIKTGEFPCDLFNYVFPQAAWKDMDTDGFCETSITTSYTGADGVPTTMGSDEAYLYKNATFIIPTDANKDKVPAAKLADCSILKDSVSTSRLKGSAYGLVWDQGICGGIGSNLQAGTPDNPLVLVADGNVKIQGRMFGLLFVRPDVYNGDPGGITPLDPTTGGATDDTACLEMDGGAAIYGAVVVQGEVCRINGTSAIIYNSTVLSNLGSEQALNPFSPVPAAWTDRFAY